VGIYWHSVRNVRNSLALSQNGKEFTGTLQETKEIQGRSARNKEIHWQSARNERNFISLLSVDNHAVDKTTASKK